MKIFFMTMLFIFVSQISADIIDADFDEIVRFDALKFEENSLSTQSKDDLKQILKKIEKYQSNDRDIIITILGHTSSTTDDKNENKIESTTYAKTIQNIFSDSFDTNSSLEKSKTYAKEIQKYLIDQGVDETLTLLEYKAGNYSAYSDETDLGRDLSNRVMLTIYVKENLDLDGDGVSNSNDFCPKTPKGLKVDEVGCKYSTIVLLSENNKKHNAIFVTTEKNSALIENVNDYTFIKSKTTLVEVLKNMPKEEIAEIFGDVLIGANQDKVKITLYFNKLDLVTSSQEKLLKVIELISKIDDAYINISGHTDTKGTKNHNEVLAKDRAEYIAKKIKESNVSYLHMSVDSYGEINQLMKTADEVSEPLNKRVEILIL